MYERDENQRMIAKEEERDGSIAFSIAWAKALRQTIDEETGTLA